MKTVNEIDKAKQMYDRINLDWNEIVELLSIPLDSDVSDNPKAKVHHDQPIHQVKPKLDGPELTSKVHKEIDKASQICGKRVPRDWKPDAIQECWQKALDLQSQGVKLTSEVLGKVVVDSLNEIWHSQIHDAPHREVNGKQFGDVPASVDEASARDDEGNAWTLGDTLPSRAGYANTEEYALARLAIRSMPKEIREIALLKLQIIGYCLGLARKCYTHGMSKTLCKVHFLTYIIVEGNKSGA